MRARNTGNKQICTSTATRKQLLTSAMVSKSQIESIIDDQNSETRDTLLSWLERM